MLKLYKIVFLGILLIWANLKTFSLSLSLSLSLSISLSLSLKSSALSIFIYACVASLRMVAASASLHNSMLERVLMAPMAFFDSTPLGRIVNRFSRDVETLDNQLPQIVFMLVTCVFSVAATIMVICVDTPWFSAVLLPLLLAYLAVQVSMGVLLPCLRGQMVFSSRHSAVQLLK